MIIRHKESSILIWSFLRNLGNFTSFSNWSGSFGCVVTSKQWIRSLLKPLSNLKALLFFGFLHNPLIPVKATIGQLFSLLLRFAGTMKPTRNCKLQIDKIWLHITFKGFLFCFWRGNRRSQLLAL